MIAVTGASGQLGQLVLKALLKNTPPTDIVAIARNTEKLAPFAAQGITIRHGDYDAPNTLTTAFEGVQKVLLISASDVGQRTPQHQAVINAATAAGVELIAYTSILHADRSPMVLAEEHRATETMLKESGLPHVILRNSWYTENYLLGIPAALELGTLYGAAGSGKIASATRLDYAEAAARVLTSTEEQAGRLYELAGDTSYTLEAFAAELSRQTGKTITYQDLPEADYKAALTQAGIPDGFAAILAQSDASAAKGALFDDSHDLSTLLGRPTTSLADAMASALAE